MALQPRKFMQKPEKIDQKYATPCYMCYICPDDCSSYLSPPPPPQPPPQKHQISTILILMICVLTSAFLLLSYLAIRRYRSRRRNSSSSYLGNGVFREDFIDENQGQGPVLDHHIWFIRTVGLPQPLIDLIPVFRYKNGEGLIEGRDCSVCLSEFEEDESLRILPKCSHAFHLPCIDTWLRSHKNCPVCRAPVSIDTDMDTYMGRVDPVEPDPGLGSTEENRTDIGSETDESIETRGVVENHNVMLLKDRFRVLSDLADHHRGSVDRDLKPVRRSFSMDFSYGSMICTKKDEESSGVEMAIVEKQNLEMISKRGSRNTIVCNNKLMKTYSHGCLVQK